MVDLLCNKEAFLKKQPKKFIFGILIFILFGILLFSTYKIKVYDNYQTKGYIYCCEECKLVVDIPSNISIEKIYVNNKEVNYTVLSEELKIDESNLISYYQLTLDVSGFSQDKEIVDVYIYYNKQRIITKIKDKMF